MGSPKWLGSWPGGRQRAGRQGTVYVLEQTREDHRYSFTLEVESERDAMAELALFNRDPDAYCRQREEIIPRLSEANIEHFCRDKAAEGLSDEHVENVLRHYLTEWLDLFKGRDLREFRLAEAQAWLKQKAKDPKTGKLVPKRGVSKRIVALKSFTAWLRRGGDSIEACLDRKDDWTLDLVCPEEKRTKTIEEKTYSLDHVEAIYARISPWNYRAGTGNRTSDAQSIRDVVRIASTTGLHLKEIDRLARRKDGDNLVGKIERLADQPYPIAGVFTVWHKNGFKHRVAVNQETLEAGLRLQAKGKAPEKSYVHRCLDRAAERAGRPEIEPGSLRHSFISWGNTVGTSYVTVNGAGIPAHVMAQICGHSLATNLKHYRNAIEPLAVLPLKLQHPEDPKPEPARGEAEARYAAGVRGVRGAGG